jgi:sigma-B regulation protein RsbU (phosphoserine phosphatase)
LHEYSPSKVLAVLNDALCDDRTPRELCGVAYARLDRVDGGFRLKLSIGGHPLPLLLRPDGTVLGIGTYGVVLGAEEDPQLVDTTVVLHPGDCVLLYTDGLTDAYAPARTLAPADVESLLASSAGSSADDIADHIYGAVLDLSPSEPRDDIALLILRIGDRALAGNG